MEKSESDERSLKYKIKANKLYKIEKCNEDESSLKYRLNAEKKMKKQQNFLLYHHGTELHSHHGVGIVTNRTCKYHAVSERILSATTQVKDKTLVFISAYAPTMDKKEDAKDSFYYALESYIDKIPKSHLIIIAGDFNAKVGTDSTNHEEVMGRFGKRTVNSNGSKLLELATKYDFVLTNTLFKHKLAHVTTWQSSGKNRKSWNGQARRNDIRNQIDYVLVQQRLKTTVNNARSYAGTNKYSDHNLVVTTMELDWKRVFKQNPSKEKQFDVSKLKDKETNSKYNQAVQTKLNSIEVSTWDNIKNAIKSAALTVLGHRKPKTARHNDSYLTGIAMRQKELRLLLNQTKDVNTRAKIKKIFKKNQRKTRKHVTFLAEERISELANEIEGVGSDANRYFGILKQLQRKEKKKALIIDSKDGQTTDPQEQANLIADHFESVFTMPDVNNNMPQHRTLDEPFTAKEIAKAIQSLKTNRAPGIDFLQTELVKNAPKDIQIHIANILNNMATTGEIPEDIQLGILDPIQKPGKKRGPITNLRPIMLMSILRKILAICLINRTYETISCYIPPSQAAYQPGRSTTENVFAIKLIIEQAISTLDSDVHLLLLDMSAAFDCVDRSKLLDDLGRILSDDILFLTAVLVNNTKVKVRNNGLFSRIFTTNVGVAQGDCYSALLFIFYLACSMYTNHINKTQEKQRHVYRDHAYAIPEENPCEETGIEEQYADDLTWINLLKEEIERIKQLITNRLNDRNLRINPTKTEEYHVKRAEIKKKKCKKPVDNTVEPWRKCKLLGSLLDTKQDIKRRKSLAWAAFAKFKDIFNKRRNFSLKTRLRVFKTYISSVFLYNSELWTVSKTTEDEIDKIQRRLLRAVLNIRYPEIISNEDLYRITDIKPWSEIITKKRLSWTGHLLRLDPETPARKALTLTQLRTTRKPQGRQINTWIKRTQKDLIKQNIGLKFDNPETYFLAENRKEWRRAINSQQQC